MAQAALKSTPDKERFDRIITLLMRGGTAIVRGLFDHIHHPSALANALQNHRATLDDLRRRRILTKEDFDNLFPSSTSYGESENFDLTLLLKLLRNICNLTAPTTGWDLKPNGSDLVVEADLVRIRLHRNNTYAHNSKMALSENKFNALWDEVSEALLRILRYYTNNPQTIREWETEIRKIRTRPISLEDIKKWFAGFPKMIIKCSYKIPGFVGNAAMSLFNQFKDDFQQLLVVLQDVISPTQGIVVENIYYGSVEIQLSVREFNALEDLWERYTSGKLKIELEKVLITDEIRKLGKNVELTVTMSEEEYLDARNFFEELTLHKVKKESIADTKEIKEVRERLDELSLDIVHGETISDRKSKFQAHFAEVTSKAQIKKLLDHIGKDLKYAQATNIIWAYRLHDADKDTFISDCDDGGEYFAGRRLKLLLEKISAVNVVVMVTCWQGDAYEYPDVYMIINKSALQLLMIYGLVKSKEEVKQVIEEDIDRFLEKFEAYFEKKKHKIAHAAFEAMKQAQVPETPTTEFEIIHGEIIPDRKNKFQAHIAQVTSQEQVEQVLEQLKREPKIFKATYNMLAYRIYVKEKKSFLEEGRDDGENEAGKRLLHLLQISKVENAVVIVTRWHSGVHIGPDRFKHINACALEVINMATERGMIATGSSSAEPVVEPKKKGKTKGKRKS